jgi:hypothetical protein
MHKPLNSEARAREMMGTSSGLSFAAGADEQPRRRDQFGM